MPLPLGGSTQWPPKELAAAQAKWSVWSAWYSGDPDRLSSVYGGGYSVATAGNTYFGTDAGINKPGLAQRIARWFWSAPAAPGEQRTKIHVPIAGDIATLSAEQLFADDVDIKAAESTQDRPLIKPVDPASPAEGDKTGTGLTNPATATRTSRDNKTQERIDRYKDEQGLLTRLREGAEIGAALGGAYWKASWDEEIADMPWINMIQPESAIPEFRWSKLVAVTFWRVIFDDKQVVVRHLERHEMQNKEACILHGVYVGTSDELGVRVPLTDYPETAALADVLTDGDQINTGIDMLTAGYVPNKLPNRSWRHDPHLVHFGRSDYDGVEGLMDALDETWSSWMRDIRLGKARIIVDQNALQTMGKGKGASFNIDEEVLVGLPLGPNPDSLITENQFGIRVVEHQETTKTLIENITRSCGYSVSSISTAEGAGPTTATEITAREKRTLTTRAQKIQYWAPEIRDMVTVLLKLDNVFFNAGVSEEPPTVEFSDGVVEDPKDLAQTLVFLNTAEVVSQYTKIQMLHPEWDDNQIEEEQARISDESAQRNQALIDMMPDPADPNEAKPGSVGKPPVGPRGPAAPTVKKPGGRR